MNAEYWKSLLLGKPSVLFNLTLLVVLASLLAVVFNPPLAGIGAIFGLVGVANLKSAFRSRVNDVRKPWIVFMIAVALTSGVVGFPPASTFAEGLRHLSDIGRAGMRDLFGKEPPLIIRHERRTGDMGLENVDVLIITNKSDKGVVPVAASVRDANSTIPISLPPLFKPYESVEVRLKDPKSKWVLKSGDRLDIQCESFSETLSVNF